MVNEQSTLWYEKSQLRTILKEDMSIAWSWIRRLYWQFGKLQKSTRCSETANCSKTWRLEKKIARQIRKEFLLYFSKIEGKWSKLTHAIENLEFSSFSLQRFFKTGSFTRILPANWSIYIFQNIRSSGMKVFKSRFPKTTPHVAEGKKEVKYKFNINLAATTSA